MKLTAAFRINPFARLLFFYLSGIVLASRVRFDTHIFWVVFPVVALILLVTALLIIWRRPGYRTDRQSGIIIAVILFIAGLVNFSLHSLHGTKLRQTKGFSGMVGMEITEPVTQTGKSVKAVGLMRDMAFKQKVLIYFEKDSLSTSLVPGDRIICRIRLSEIAPPLNPGEFNYSKYLAARNIYNQTYLRAGMWKPLPGKRTISPKAMAYRLQQRLLDKYREIGLNKTYYSILSALTLGYKSDLEAHTRQVFSKAGVMHVMALSGYNVAVLAYALSILLFFTVRIRHGTVIKTIIIILIIWIFAFVTGLSPSVTRASVMISLVMTGKAINRHIKTTNILYASAFILLALSPALIFDISFQLSFAAVFGIIVFYPPLSGSLSFKYTLPRKIWQLFSVACAAQLSTMPLTLYYFHQFPVYFWLTNLYVVPLVSLIICVAGVFLLLSFNNTLMLVTGKILGFILGILYKSVVLIEIMPFSVFENICLNSFQVLLLFSFLIVCGIYVFHRKSAYIIAAFSIIAALQVISLFRMISLNNQQIVLVGNVRGTSVINIINGHNSLLLSESNLNKDSRIQYALGNFWINRGVADREKIHIRLMAHEDIHFSFAGRSFLILNDKSIENPISVDYLILTNKAYGAEKDAFCSLIKAQQIIIDSSVPDYKSDKWLSLCKESKTDCWIVSKQGAWIFEKKKRSKDRQRQFLAGQ